MTDRVGGDEALIGGYGIECRAPDRDRRWFAVCWSDNGLALNAEMVRLGWTLAYRPGNEPFRRPKYESQEVDARAAGRGMWRGTFMASRDWRHRQDGVQATHADQPMTITTARRRPEGGDGGGAPSCTLLTIDTRDQTPGRLPPVTRARR